MLHVFLWFFIDFTWIFMILHDFYTIVYDLTYILIDFIWFYVDLYAFWCVYMRFWYVYELGVPNQRACGASPTSEKTRPWIFGAGILCILLIFVTFSLVCPISVPAALRRPQKKHAPGILEHVPCVFCRFVLFVVRFLKFGVLILLETIKKLVSGETN